MNKIECDFFIRPDMFACSFSTADLMNKFIQFYTNLYTNLFVLVTLLKELIFFYKKSLSMSNCNWDSRTDPICKLLAHT